MLEAATAALLHRGPDDKGEYDEQHVAFRVPPPVDHRSDAGRPSADEHVDERLTVVFNGEIYNYVELRAELISLGHRFRSTCDTEVLLAAYRQWGTDCVHRFNGMWAFLIHDRETNLVFGSRDRLGVKPLYVWQDSDWLVFASEPRAIAATGLDHAAARLVPSGRVLVWLRWTTTTEPACQASGRYRPARDSSSRPTPISSWKLFGRRLRWNRTTPGPRTNGFPSCKTWSPMPCDFASAAMCRSASRCQAASIRRC